jgi:hypothetical protein
MNTLRLNPAVIGLLLLVIASGCAHKKPVLVMPQQQPPTTAPQPTPVPADTQPAEQPEAAQPAATPAEQPRTGEKTAEKTKPRRGHQTATKKPAASASSSGGDKSEVAHNTTGKKVIPPDPELPSPQSGQISPGPMPTDVTHSQISTDQLLQGAEANLNGITRPLSKDEEAMRAQSREFIKQSRAAITENDLARAHNLAVKARLLSDELSKQR